MSDPNAGAPRAPPPSQTPSPSAAAARPDIAIVGTDLKIVDEGGEEELLEPYKKFREEPIHALQELGLHVLGTAWRSYDRVIGREIFYPGFSDNMRAMVMRQPKLQAKIAELAKKRVEVEIHEGLLGPKGEEGERVEVRARRAARRRAIVDELNHVAEDWTDKMICKMDSRVFIRGAYYLATQLITRAYDQGIHVSSQEVLHIRKVAKEAAKKKQSIVFLPCHRSHVDYVSLQLICYRLGLALPTVVAGDNLNFPVVGSFLQHAGAMWIRRSFGGDELYNTLVQSYMDTLLQNGHNIECFVEGGRSRTGKLLPPKFGILSFILDSVLSGNVDDVLICPVSTQYDKVIEVDSYISELLGQPKKKEDLASFLSASNVLSLKLGRVDVRFHNPWSLKDFIAQQATQITKSSPSTSSVSNADPAFRRKVLSTLGYRVLSDINDASVIMPTALVGTVLLTLTGRSVGRAELFRRVQWLSDRVHSRGGRLAHFAGSATEEVVDKALDVLGPGLVGRIEGLPEEMYYAQDRFQLSFYRNMTIHLFILQSLVCAAMYTKVKLGGGSESERMPYRKLYDYVFFLSQLFRAEFIFPTAPLSENLNKTLEGLLQDGVLDYTRNDKGDIDTIGIHPDERALDMQNFEFYCFLLWPFIEASWLGAISLFMLTSPPMYPDAEAWLDLSELQNKAQLLGKTLYHRGDLTYYEAVNKEALKNAIGGSEERGTIVVSRSTKDSKSPPKVRLDPEWMPTRDEHGHFVPRGELWKLCERINQSRRDGGSRKEGGTERSRILGLADQIGRELFESAAAPADVDGKVQRSRRRQGIRTRTKGKL